MDASVLAALAKWPDVPAVYGWLSLTARGEWRLCGEPIGNAVVREFIGRNYAGDTRGRWYFQNGPQRVYVALELAPWVYRFHPDGRLRTFTGVMPRRLLGAALVDGARFALLTELGAGGIDDRDAEHFLGALVDAAGRPLDEAELELALGGGQANVDAVRAGLIGGVLSLQRVSAADLGAVFGFKREPAPN
jgi:Protein of unknown function (DUF2946)